MYCVDAVVDFSCLAGELFSVGGTAICFIIREMMQQNAAAVEDLCVYLKVLMCDCTSLLIATIEQSLQM